MRFAFTGRRPKAWTTPASAGRRAIAGTALVLALLSLSAIAQQSLPARSTGAGVADALDARRLVTELEVNGLKVLVKQREGSQTVAAALFLRGGARNVTAENAGIESLMLDMATEATAAFPRERLRRELARTGTVLSAGVNLDYSGMTLGSTRQHFDRAWEIFVDAALHPSFAPDDFERIHRQKLIALSDDEDTPDSYLQILTSRQVYAGHPYLADPDGSLESMRRLTLDDVKQYHQRMMQTSRLLLVVVGDIDPAALQAKVAASFGTLARGDYRDTPLPQLEFAQPTVTITARDLPTNYVQGIFAAPPITSPDIYAMRVAATILRERFFTEIRVRRSLSYAPDAMLHSLGANTGSIYFTAVDANQTAQVMLNEIGRLQTDLIRQDQISAVAQQFLTTYYMGQETNAAQTGELAEYELIGGGWRNAAEVLDRLRAVTPEDVRRVANVYIRNIQFVSLGNPRSIDRGTFTRR
jgi:predicted Zn-dependent peptidase